MIDELIKRLLEMKQQLMDEVTNEKIEKLESENEYLRNLVKQNEVKIVRLETRIAEICNLLNGVNDKVWRGE